MDVADLVYITHVLGFIEHPLRVTQPFTIALHQRRRPRGQKTAPEHLKFKRQFMCFTWLGIKLLKQLNDPRIENDVLERSGDFGFTDLSERLPGANEDQTGD